MVDDVMDLFCCKLMQNGDSNSTIGKHGKKSCCPSSTVSAAKCNLVTLLDTGTFKHDMKLFYLAGNIVILQCCAFKVSQRVEIPMVYDAFLNHLIEAGNRACHIFR